MEDEQLLTVRQVAGRLAISPAQVYELMATKRLPSLKIDKSRRLRVADVNAYVRELSDVAQKGTNE